VDGWIERRTERERMHQRALGSADTLEQRRVLDSLGRMTPGGGDGALQIVRDRE
jgi:hypothetical protein